MYWLPETNETSDKKKILGFKAENEGDFCIALSPNCYYLNDEQIKIKMKGVIKD
jgi:hypothetical protein